MFYLFHSNWLDYVFVIFVNLLSYFLFLNFSHILLFLWSFLIFRIKGIIFNSKRFFNSLFDSWKVETVFVFHFGQVPFPQVCISRHSLDRGYFFLVHVHSRKYNLIISSPNKIFMNKNTVSQPWCIVIKGLILIERILPYYLFSSVWKKPYFHQHWIRNQVNVFICFKFCMDLNHTILWNVNYHDLVISL